LLVAGIFGVTALVVVLLGYFAGALAAYVPFSTERALAAQFPPIPDTNPPLQEYLQRLADRLASAEHLPDDMPITVHYVDAPTVNAFATLGGNIVFFRGLLKRLPDENALAMVMAHEIAHVRTRAPLSGLGRGVVMAAALALVDQSLGSSLAANALGQTGLLTQLGFSREQEREADRIGQAALVARYGGTAGVDELFCILKRVDVTHDEHVPSLYRSHPEIDRRVRALHRQARDHGWPRGATTGFPAAFAGWLKSENRAK